MPIPKDKSDLSTIPILIEMDEDDINPILPELLTWVADMNWPVAAEMAKVLVRFSNSAVPHIKEILKPMQKDEEWKWHIITGLLPQLQPNSQKLLMEDINRVIHSPTDSEIASDVQEQAKSYTRKISEDAC